MKKYKFILSTQEYGDMRYKTCGDWIDSIPAEIVVSEMHNPDYEFLVMIHELIECYLCKKKGITMQEVDVFDMDYEVARERGGQAKCGCTPTKDSEPGYDKHARYRDEHCFAEHIEKKLANKLGISWEDYEKVITNL